MTKTDAERAIVAEMRKLLPQVPYSGATGGLREYQQLRRERPELFEFKRSGGDEWQIVSGWLRKHKLIS